MKKSASIFVKGTQWIDGEKDCIEFSSDGCVEINDRGLRLMYHELTDTGESSQTTLTLIGQTLKIERNGANEMSMIIKKGKRSNCSLDTPMGAMLIGTYGTALAHEDNYLSCIYELDMNAVLMSRNRLEITYITDKE